jgi:hypothetical protein
MALLLLPRRGVIGSNNKNLKRWQLHLAYNKSSLREFFMKEKDVFEVLKRDLEAALKKHPHLRLGDKDGEDFTKGSGAYIVKVYYEKDDGSYDDAHYHELSIDIVAIQDYQNPQSKAKIMADIIKKIVRK